MGLDTLVERARVVPLARKNLKLSDEWVEASLAWVKGEVTIKQLVIAAQDSALSGGNVLYRVAVHLREAYRRGRIKIEPRKP